MSRINDLRTFIDKLRQHDRIACIEKEVDWDVELGSVLATLEKTGGKAGYFENVKGSKFAVAGGMLSSMQNVALALDCDISEITRFIENRLNKPVESIVVQNAPCQENVLLGSDANLLDLPIPRHAPGDGGRFITGGVIFSKRPGEPSRQNLSFQRMHIKEGDKAGIMINEWRHLRDFMEEAQAKGEKLPISVVSGADPVIYIAAGLRSDLDEISLAGGLRGEAIPMVKSVTNDIMVPAKAEFVIEGVIDPEQLELEGPLGEFTGHYSEPWNSPVFHLTAITHRNDAIYQTINGGSFEHINLGNSLPREPLLHHFCSYVSSGVLDVHIPAYGSGFLAIIQIKKKNPGEPKNIALAAMMTYVNIKNVIVVDGDVDIYNASDVMWAISTRVKSEEDIFYVPNSQGHELDPSSNERGVQTKMGIDATKDESSRWHERVVYSQVDLKEYID
ncbi:MAG TPA: UbiD family decarboxylase [Oscillospiraceae bacterium]|nr:UbiD family decarboxylase [Oscillospiraceae bacterium]